MLFVNSNMLDYSFRWQYYAMSGTRAQLHKRTSLRDLLDKFADAQRLDVKAYCSGHLNESKLYHLPNQATHSLWPRHNQTPMSVPEISAKSRSKVKKDGLGELTHETPRKQHCKLKPLKLDKLPKFVKTVDSKYVSCSAVSSQIQSTSEPQEGGCRASLDDQSLDDPVCVEELHLPSQINYDQKTGPILFDTASASDFQQPATESFLPHVVPRNFKAATKKDQFRKMRDYHNNVIQCPAYVQQHAVTGSDAVKYLEHRLHKV